MDSKRLVLFPLKKSAITHYLLDTFPGINVVNVWGETSFFYNPGGLLKRGIYFCTIKEKNGENDKASDLDRENVFRLNFAVSKSKFVQLFDLIPKRPAKGGVISGLYDFTKLDILMPHPVYGWMSWVGILSPSQESWGLLKKLLDENYKSVVEKYETRKI